MGRRYSAIFDYLDAPYVGVDAGEEVPENDYSGVLIATPTETHLDLIKHYASLGIPILCEKPIVKTREGLEELLGIKAHLSMVNQYEFLVSRSHDAGECYYDYWNSGKDGLIWDCINIIGLSYQPPRLGNTSPVWKCSINGRALNIRDMDLAYIRMISDWLKKPDNDGMSYIELAHRKVFDEEYIIDS